MSEYKITLIVEDIKSSEKLTFSMSFDEYIEKLKQDPNVLDNFLKKSLYDLVNDKL